MARPDASHTHWPVALELLWRGTQGWVTLVASAGGRVGRQARSERPLLTSPKADGSLHFASLLQPV